MGKTESKRNAGAGTESVPTVTSVSNTTSEVPETSAYPNSQQGKERAGGDFAKAAVESMGQGAYSFETRGQGKQNTRQLESSFDIAFARMKDAILDSQSVPLSIHDNNSMRKSTVADITRRDEMDSAEQLEFWPKSPSVPRKTSESGFRRRSEMTRLSKLAT